RLAQIQPRFHPILAAREYPGPYASLHILGIGFDVVDQVKHLLRRVMHQRRSLNFICHALPQSGAAPAYSTPTLRNIGKMPLIKNSSTAMGEMYFSTGRH